MAVAKPFPADAISQIPQADFERSPMLGGFTLNDVCLVNCQCFFGEKSFFKK